MKIALRLSSDVNESDQPVSLGLRCWQALRLRADHPPSLSLARKAPLSAGGAWQELKQSFLLRRGLERKGEEREARGVVQTK